MTPQEAIWEASIREALALLAKAQERLSDGCCPEAIRAVDRQLEHRSATAWLHCDELRHAVGKLVDDIEVARKRAAFRGEL